MLLKTIKGPPDLRKLSLQELRQLASEIRETIVSTVSKTGGHLASSLGAVEFTIAIHYVFNTPDDCVIWDVGHQSYAHKLLTGRQEKFPLIRQYKGLSGFIDPRESEYDSFFTGHAGTALSLADGVAQAFQHLGRTDKVIAVAGDASLSNGMSFEAINNIGHRQSKIIFILNDNEMSISKNVGAMAKYFNKVITQPFYNKLKNKTWVFLRKIPLIGKPIVHLLDRLQEYFKGLFLPAIIFEELGFRYIGPIDGHNIEQLISTFRRVEFMTDRPLLIHLITRKGKGYEPAEDNPESYHGVSKPGKKSLSFTSVFSRTVVKAAERDSRIVAVTAAMKEGTGLSDFAVRFPLRFYDVGIAEEHAVTFSAGLAKAGMKPFVAIYSSFLQRAYDQIIHDVCLPSLPVKFFIDRAGIVGDDGPTHNGTFDISYLLTIPNLVLLSPRDENELQHLIWSMAGYDKGPIAVRYPRGSGPGVELEDEPKIVDFFKNEVLVDGKDLVIFATGPLVHKALRVAESLRASKDAGVAVVNCRCLKPLDEENILAMADRTKRVVTLEENTVKGGFGNAISTLLLQKSINGVKSANIGLPDAFIEVGGQDQIRDLYGLSEENIRSAVLKLLQS